jgi:hypothetical protein
MIKTLHSGENSGTENKIPEVVNLIEKENLRTVF